MKRPSVSIVVPIGPGRTGFSALESCESSAFLQACEKIIVVDGPRTGAVVLPDKLQRIRVVELNRHRGAAYARNEGVRHSANELICFLDDDDRLEGDGLEMAVNHLWRDSSIGAISLKPRYQSGRRNVFSRRAGFLTERDLLTRNRLGGCSGVIIRKTLFQKAGGFDEAFPSMQDWDLWLRLSRITQIHVSGIPGVLYDDVSDGRISGSAELRLCGLKMLMAKHGAGWPRSILAIHESRQSLIEWQARLSTTSASGVPPLRAAFRMRAPFTTLALWFKYGPLGRRL